MKAKSFKGFTLVELIVVIAIIGVLTAILVPSMLGYVRKANVSSVNSNAKSLYNAVVTALVELDGEGYSVEDGCCREMEKYVDNVRYSRAPSKNVAISCSAPYMQQKVYRYFNGIGRLDGGYGWKVTSSAVVAAAVRRGKYTGTHPHIATTDNSTVLMIDSEDVALNTTNDGLLFAENGQ